MSTLQKLTENTNLFHILFFSYQYVHMQATVGVIRHIKRKSDGQFVTAVMTQPLGPYPCFKVSSLHWKKSRMNISDPDLPFPPKACLNVPVSVLG